MAASGDSVTVQLLCIYGADGKDVKKEECPKGWQHQPEQGLGGQCVNAMEYKGKLNVCPEKQNNLKVCGLDDSFKIPDGNKLFVLCKKPEGPCPGGGGWKSHSKDTCQKIELISTEGGIAKRGWSVYSCENKFFVL